MTTTHFVLVPGLWLGGWAWDRVAEPLRAGGHLVTAVTLPGLDDLPSPSRGSQGHDRVAAELRDHVRHLAAVVTDAPAEADVVLVAHSGAGKVVTALVDADPSAVQQVIYVDSGPSADGDHRDLPAELLELPLPSWAELAAQGSSLEGLDDDDLRMFRERAVPHPAGPLREPLRLTHPERRQVPSTLVACSLGSELVRRLAQQGEPMFAEVAQLTDVEFVDLPTGHWPMWSRPAELAAALVQARR